MKIGIFDGRAGQGRTPDEPGECPDFFLLRNGCSKVAKVVLSYIVDVRLRSFFIFFVLADVVTSLLQF